MGGHPLPRFVLGILHGEQMAEAQSIGHVQQRRAVLRLVLASALRRLSVRGEISGRRANSALARSDASPNLSRR